MAALAVAAGASAQADTYANKPDYIESTALNDARRGSERVETYYPEGEAFTCVNGKNRYTRALYGGYTEYRVETSDMPIFAIYKKKNYRNIRFEMADGLRLDSVSYCRARYADGMRSYELSDESWGGGRISLDVVAPTDEESALWRFAATGFDSPVTLTAKVSEIASTKLKRSGDIGVDDMLSFEPKAGAEPLATRTWTIDNDTTYFYFSIEAGATELPDEEAARLFGMTAAYFDTLAHRVTFSTPDPYINTLGNALCVAADGDWDGQTWLHGCIGWRMPLAGWRAAYAGDVLGWNDRARSHFDAYAASQVTDVEPVIPHPSMDKAMNLARAEKKWGTQMYSNGYICRNPGKNNQMHHYDMNLNYMDELLWHFCYDADTTYMREMWPVIVRHLEWEKRNYDPDGDHLYDAYCCIWASDALYYSGGAVTHSSAYNYRGNLLASRIAEIIGEDGSAYEAEAEAIRKAMDERLWQEEKADGTPAHWVEFEESLGLKRKHESAALWSVYTAIDCGVGTAVQAYQATRYVDECIPHITVASRDSIYGATISTSCWMPYAWSINNVAAAEVMHTALAYFEAGQAEQGYALLKSNVMDQMYLSDSPGNFGQLSSYDAARGECYRDFGDCIGISSRTLLQGLFGIVPDALYGRCIVRPGFPSAWDSASVSTPYMTYSFKRVEGKEVYEITQHFTRPLKIILRKNIGEGKYVDIIGTDETTQTICVEAADKQVQSDSGQRQSAAVSLSTAELGLDEPPAGKYTKVVIDDAFNANVTDIFRNEYLSPRSPYTTLQIPVQGYSEWCHPQATFNVDDSVFRSMITGDEYTVAGVPFRTPAEGLNIAFTSLWDNYPDSIVVPAKGKASSALLLLAGSTNHMQSRIDNGLVIATYKDGSTDTLRLINPDNWCPIDQDYFIDGKAFCAPSPRPYRLCFSNGLVSRDIAAEMGITGVYMRNIKGGAAQLLNMPLDGSKTLKSITLRTLSNEVVIGLMAITLCR